MVTYDASGPMLNADIFKEYPGVDLTVDECYSTVDHAVKYTLFHLVSRARQSTIEKFMSYAARKYGIVSTKIFGYASISANNSSNELFTQVGFQMLFKHKTENNPSFVSWIESLELRGCGILETYQRKHQRTAGRSQVDSGEEHGPNKRFRRDSSIGSVSSSDATTTTTTGLHERVVEELTMELAQSKGEVNLLKSELEKATEEATQSKDKVSTLTSKLEKADSEVSALTLKLAKEEDNCKKVVRLEYELQRANENASRTIVALQADLATTMLIVRGETEVNCVFFPRLFLR